MADYAIHHASLGARSGFLARAADTIQNLRDAYHSWAARRAEREDVRNLLLLESWALDDMGLTRADVYNALDLQPNRSPKAYLARRRDWNAKRMRLRAGSAF